MNELEQPPRSAWQPFTPKGVAAFAHAPLGRLLAVQLLFALTAAGSIVWCGQIAWAPVIDQAISQLPEFGWIQHGELVWSNSEPVSLAENKFLGIGINPGETAFPSSTSDLFLELGKTEVRLRSLPGSVRVGYPANSGMALNRLELGPWWGAWKPALLVGAGLGAGILLLLGWWILGMVYLWPVKFLAFFLDRQVSCLGAWKLAGAALLPPSVFMSGALLLYASQKIDLLELALAGTVHLAMGWILLLLGSFRLPRLGPSRKEGRKRRQKNPFKAAPER